MQDAIAKHPANGTHFQYGTAGFRTQADVLDPVLMRVGLLASLCSQARGGAAIGIMVTASHNPVQDNGAKIVEPMGEMLQMAWEAYATRLANCADSEIAAVIEDIAKDTNTDRSVKPKVVLGRDTRPSGAALVQAAKDGCSAMGAEIVDIGVVTTPELHHVVRCLNDSSYGTPTTQGYFSKMAASFKRVLETASVPGPIRIKVDCANGVGAPELAKLLEHLSGVLEAEIHNDGSSGELNSGCGADFVKSKQMAPEGFAYDHADRCVTFDGDADRVLYFFKRDSSFFLLDGDRIAVLAADFLGELVRQSKLSLDIGVVQTAYANGNSTAYLNEVAKVPVACTKTGVKHLHHQAVKYDVGVYFEANGHGTVVFSEKALKMISEASSEDPAAKVAITRLQAMTELINQTVGDAISDMLMVEAILACKGLDCEAWAQLYTDLPNVLMKVKVADRTAIKTTNAERQCTAPPGLQEAIDALVSKTPKGRSFVRPSGTEDAVRVYAEAGTKDAAHDLAHKVAIKVYELAAGIGDLPQRP